MDTSSASSILSTIAAYVVVIAIVALIWYIMQVVAMWKIFTKAGVAGWKSIIPFYNSYCLFRLSWKDEWVALVYLVCSVVGTIISFAVFGNDTKSVWNNIADILAFASGVLIIVRCFKISKAFGHGVGFGFGLLFFNTIFKLILAFSSDKYVGAN